MKETCRKKGVACPECGKLVEWPDTTCRRCGYTLKTVNVGCMRH